MSTRAGYEPARLELARLRLDAGTGVDGALARAVRVSARSLGVERVGVWLLDASQTRLTCRALYVKSEDRVFGGDALDARALPAYVAALRERRAIVADDARTHPLTRELRELYLEPLGITSMLDAPLYRRGEVVGVVCHEHVGPPRAWTQAEIDFASSVADLVSTLFGQAEAMELEDELVRRAARLRDADRFESIARVCGAIAHDVNNVLAMVSMVAASLGRGAADGRDRELARALEHAVSVGARLVDQIKNFGPRAGDDAPRAVVGDVLAHLRPMVELMVRDVAALEVRVDAPAAAAAISNGHLEQVLLNLCLNARDAISRAGTVEVIVREAGGDVVIEVKDDGSGIPAEVLPNVFEPYFTTKPKGTGLGLATARDLVVEHGGAISVASEVGRGTTFTVTLPRAS